MVKLLTLSATLDPKGLYKLFNGEKICDMAIKFYHDGFTKQEKLHLRIQA